jgi:hypothetical protein
MVGDPAPSEQTFPPVEIRKTRRVPLGSVAWFGCRLSPRAFLFDKFRDATESQFNPRGVIANAAYPRRLILGRAFDAIDDEDLQRGFSRFEFYAELLLDGRRECTLVGFRRGWVVDT